MKQKDFLSLDERRINEENPPEEFQRIKEKRGEKERNTNLNIR